MTDIQLVIPPDAYKNVLARICGQCGVTFTKENSEHHLQPNCNHCTSHPATYEKYNKLLAFVKLVNKPDHGMDYWDIADIAGKLLEEIGEKEFNRMEKFDMEAVVMTKGGVIKNE